MTLVRCSRWPDGRYPVVVVGHHRPYVETPKILVVHDTTRRGPTNLMPSQVRSPAITEAVSTPISRAGASAFRALGWATSTPLETSTIRPSPASHLAVPASETSSR